MARPSLNSSKKKLDKVQALDRLVDIELKVFKKLKIKNKYAEVALISNSEMEKIRKELVLRTDFKGREAEKIRSEESVSVLTFPEPGGFPKLGRGPEKAGEVYINKDLTKGDLDQISYLFIHGLLHLLGYDHLSKRDSIQMEKLEKDLFLAVMDF